MLLRDIESAQKTVCGNELLTMRILGLRKMIKEILGLSFSLCVY